MGRAGSQGRDRKEGQAAESDCGRAGCSRSWTSRQLARDGVAGLPLARCAANPRNTLLLLMLEQSRISGALAVGKCSIVGGDQPDRNGGSPD